QHGEPAVSDLILVSVEPVNTLGELSVGDSATVMVRTLITNGGEIPTDALVERNATSSGVASILPASSSEEQRNVGFLELRETLTAYEVTCNGPGTATFTVD